MSDIDYSKNWYRIDSDGGVIAESNGNITDWILSTETYKLAESLLNGVSLQAVQDIRNLRFALADSRLETIQARADKEVALRDLCNEILSVFVEFGFATPEKGYASPGLLLSDLRTILKAKKGV